jgi:hypothetical protein
VSDETEAVSAEVDALIADLDSSRSSGRKPMDRYREFRAVFLATDQGKRVLLDILTMCHFRRSSVVKGDPHHTYFKEGERNAALMILDLISVEPKTPPAMQSKTTEDV